MLDMMAEWRVLTPHNATEPTPYRWRVCELVENETMRLNQP
jgi:hypothetical protein